MPHRPRLATGNLRFSYPQTLPGCAIACLRLPVASLASAPAIGRPRFGCRSYRHSPPKDGAASTTGSPDPAGTEAPQPELAASGNLIGLVRICRVFKLEHSSWKEEHT